MNAIEGMQYFAKAWKRQVPTLLARAKEPPDETEIHENFNKQENTKLSLKGHAKKIAEIETAIFFAAVAEFLFKNDKNDISSTTLVDVEYQDLCEDVYAGKQLTARQRKSLKTTIRKSFLSYMETLEHYGLFTIERRKSNNNINEIWYRISTEGLDLLQDLQGYKKC
jgi:hypothetical protein